MNGLVSYDYDSPSDSEAGPSGSNRAPITSDTAHNIGGEKHNENANDKSSKGSGKASSAEGRRIQKTQVVIKRPTVIHKSQLRTHSADELVSDEQQQEKAGTSREPSSSVDPESTQAQAGPPSEFLDPLSRLRKMLRPPLILGVEDWGIPPETTEKCEAGLQTKFAKFSSLKLDRSKPMHFNDSLMSNRSFRNPHLYTHLVDWVDVDERTTNFPKDIWDPDDVKPDWYANQIGMPVFLYMLRITPVHVVLFALFSSCSRSLPLASPLVLGILLQYCLWNLCVKILFRPAARNSWVRQFEADAQKERSEKQAAAQSSGKRNHIEFSSGSSSRKPTAHRDGGAPPRKSRFAPYSASSSSASGGMRERQKTRWG